MMPIGIIAKTKTPTKIVGVFCLAIANKSQA